MAFVSISPVKNLKALIYYVSKSKPHTPGEERVLDYKAHLCSLNSAYKSFNFTNNFMGRKKKIPGYSLVKSWSQEELDPADPESIKLALESTKLLLEEQFGKDRQYIVVCQKDGTGGKIHTHSIVCNTSISTGKAISGNDKYWKYVAYKSDEIDKRLGIKNLNKGKVYEKDGQLFAQKREDKDIITRAEKEIMSRNEEAERKNLFIKNENDSIKRRNKNMEALGLETEPLQELHKVVYLWKEDLKSRIKEAKISSKDIEEFKDRLDQAGVNVKARSSKQENTNGFRFSYSFVDKNNKNRKIRETRLGTDYSYKEISDEFNKENTKENIREDLKNKTSKHTEAKIKTLKSQNTKRLKEEKPVETIKIKENKENKETKERKERKEIKENNLEETIEEKIETDPIVNKLLKEEEDRKKKEERERRDQMLIDAYIRNGWDLDKLENGNDKNKDKGFEF